MIACAGGQLEAARYLLKYRADIDCTSVDAGSYTFRFWGLRFRVLGFRVWRVPGG